MHQKNKDTSLITLNTWAGLLLNPLLSFIHEHKNTDIFCLQELYHNAKQKISSDDRNDHLTIFSEIQALLPNHQAFFKPVVNNSFGIGMFIKKSIQVLAEGDLCIHENPSYSGSGGTHPRNLQWAECFINNKTYSILNVHGLWNGQGKSDTPARINQSHRIKNFLDTLKTPKILCGDFNLRPDTHSIQILEENLINQIKLHKITSTRTSLYPKPEPFADYIFNSPDILISKFKVLPHEVSDHAPLLLHFS